MAFPAIVNIQTKENGNPFLDPKTQLSATELNELVYAVNKNALFYGVYATSEALKNAHTDPKIGGWALLSDGTKYVSTSGNWITRDENIEQNNKTLAKRIVINNPTPNVNENTVVANQLNIEEAFLIAEDESIVVYTYQGAMDMGIHRIDYSIATGKGEYGQQGRVLSGSHIIKTAVKYVANDIRNGFNIIGDIGAQTISEYVNSNGPFGIQGDRFFEVTINDIPKVYLYKGNSGVIGLDNLQVDENDFFDIYAGSTEALLININVFKPDARFGTWTIIDGMRVDKRINKDYETIEIGDFIIGFIAPDHYVHADVLGLPYEDPLKLKKYVNSKG
ncbi:hypothetical protein ACE939_00805 [Aquimarina sp. W85]|uniref:hypothetical protein n=1 Tax=Aquimarina rhodophyticola TaxID=3342246 RepID=UPI00367036E0